MRDIARKHALAILNSLPKDHWAWKKKEYFLEKETEMQLLRLKWNEEHWALVTQNIKDQCGI